MLKVIGIDNEISMSNTLISRMQKRIRNNKWVLGGVVIFLIIFLSLILYIRMR